MILTARTQNRDPPIHGNSMDLAEVEVPSANPLSHGFGLQELGRPKAS